VRRGGHLPEPARVPVFTDRGDRVRVGVPVHPGHHARVGEQQVTKLAGRDPPVCARRAPVVHQRLQRVVAEQQHRAGCGRGELGSEPAELRGVDRALPAPVRVHGVQHEAPHDAVVEAVVGRALAGVAARVAVPGRSARRAEVLVHVGRAGNRHAAGVWRHREPRPPGQLGQGGRVRRIEPAQRVRGVDAVRRGHVLHRADRVVVQPALGRHRALQHVVVVAVHGVPGNAEPGGPERPPHRGQHARHVGEPVPAPRQVRLAAVGMPVPLVLDLGPGHALIPLRVAGVRQHLPAVEQVDVRAQLVALAVVGRVTGHHREVDGRAGQRRRPDLPHRADHGRCDLVGEQLLGPVGAHDADAGAQRRVRIGVAVEQLDPGGRLVIHHVRVRQLRDHQQGRASRRQAGRSVPSARSSRTACCSPSAGTSGRYPPSPASPGTSRWRAVVSGSAVTGARRRGPACLAGSTGPRSRATSPRRPCWAGRP
jgi:hypothetical protein